MLGLRLWLVVGKVMFNKSNTVVVLVPLRTAVRSGELFTEVRYWVLLPSCSHQTLAHLVYPTPHGRDGVLWSCLLLSRYASVPSKYATARKSSSMQGLTHPVHEFWNNHPASSKCLPKGPTLGITYALAAVNASADWALGILPFFIVWDLEMKRTTKLLVAGILAFAAM